jgi:hypothetical protein
VTERALKRLGLPRLAQEAWNIIKNEFGSGVWAIIDTVVTVNTTSGTKSAAMDGTAPESVARRLMWELARDLEPEVA